MGPGDQEQQGQGRDEAEEVRQSEQRGVALRELSVRQKVGDNADLKYVDLDDLTDEDISMYCLIRDGKVTKESYEQYKRERVDSQGKRIRGTSENTEYFIRYLDARITAFFLRQADARRQREREEERRKTRGQ